MSQAAFYKKYLESDQWANIRREIYKRAEGYCEVCQAPAEHVHHLYYPKDLANDSTAGKVAVCDRCHKAFHGIKKGTPRERAEETAIREAADFIGEYNLPPMKTMEFVRRIMFITARYHGEVSK